MDFEEWMEMDADYVERWFCGGRGRVRRRHFVSGKGKDKWDRLLTRICGTIYATKLIKKSMGGSHSASFIFGGFSGKRNSSCWRSITG